MVRLPIAPSDCEGSITPQKFVGVAEGNTVCERENLKLKTRKKKADKTEGEKKRGGILGKT